MHRNASYAYVDSSELQISSHASGENVKSLNDQQIGTFYDTDTALQ